MAADRRLAQAASGSARPPGPPQSHRLQPGSSRQGGRCGSKGGAATGPNLTDHGKAGSKCHILTDANGILLALKPTGANVHDGRMLEPLVAAVAPIQQGSGPLRKRPGKLHADKAYDHRRCRRDECRADIHMAFLTLASALIIWRFAKDGFVRYS
jgi:hypothetical protein